MVVISVSYGSLGSHLHLLFILSEGRIATQPMFGYRHSLGPYYSNITKHSCINKQRIINYNDE